jgi:hypothetical protein
MKTDLSDKLIAYLTLISGLVVSAVAVWYSVAGLVSIFAASAFAIIVMGVALETSKLVATIWLKWNWHRAPQLIKIYLISAIVILMLITSMGIFGYLSKAHLDQNIVSGDVQSKIALFDEKIKIERENIANAQAVIKQMDAAVNGVMATGDQEIKLRDGTTRIRSAAERSLQIRRSQAKDRQGLIKQIEVSQTKIVQLQEESSPIRAEMRQVEAEVGPIKYIAKLIYADDPDQNLLEKAVTWVIIIIVLVFDPLAVVLLLASQYSFQWLRQQDEERKNELVQAHPEPQATGDSPVSNPGPQDTTVDQGSGGQSAPDPELPPGDNVAEEANRKIAEIGQEYADPILSESSKEKDILTEWNDMIAEAERAVDQERELEDDEILAQAQPTEKDAMHVWKAENPDGCLKYQRKLLDRGVITELPWSKYLRPRADFTDEAAVEAKKWADENPDTEESVKAKEWAEEQTAPNDSVSWMEHDEQGNQIKKIKETYTQNAEQNDRTLWQRIQEIKK